MQAQTTLPTAPLGAEMQERIRLTSIINERTNIFRAMQDNKPLQERLDYLYMRWLDESKYEDINGYGEVLKALMPSALEIVKMNKRPFGFNVRLKGSRFTFQYKITMRANSLQLVEGK